MSVVISAVVGAFELWGTAAFVGAAITAVADVGVATTLVGAVTGNKTLMKAGAALSIVGGVGGLINSAVGTGAAAGAEALAGGATSATEGAVVDGAVTAGTEAGGAAAGAAAGADLGSSAISAANAGAGAGADAAGQWGALSEPIKFGPTLNAGPAADVAGGAADQGLFVAGQSAATPIAAPAAVSNAASQGMSITGQGAPGAAMATGDFSGVIQPVGGPNASGMYGAALDSAGTAGPATIMDQLKSGFDSTSAWFNGLPKVSQEMITKSLLAIPGGIQAQKNAAAQLAIAQQKVDQTSYGSSVPTYNSKINPSTGILSNAMRKQ